MSYINDRNLVLQELQQELDGLTELYQKENKSDKPNGKTLQHCRSQIKQLTAFAGIIKDSFLIIFQGNIYIKETRTYKLFSSLSVSTSKLDTIDMRRTLAKYTAGINLNKAFWDALILKLVEVTDPNDFDPHNHVLFQDATIAIDYANAEITVEKMRTNKFFTKKINLPLTTRVTKKELKIVDDYVRNLSTHDYEIIKELIGEIIFPIQHFQTFYWFYGNGNNGKSKFAELLSLHFNASGVTIGAISDESKSFDRHALFENHINIDGDANGVNKKSSEQIKKITGGDLMQKEKKFGAITHTTISCTLAFMSNQLPNFGVINKSLKRRLKIAHFDKDFGKNPAPGDFNKTWAVLTKPGVFAAYALECAKENLIIKKRLPNGIESNKELLNKDSITGRMLKDFFTTTWRKRLTITRNKVEHAYIVSGVKFTYIDKDYIYEIYKNFCITAGEKTYNIHSHKHFFEELHEFVPYTTVSKLKIGTALFEQNFIKIAMTDKEKISNDHEDVEIVE